jgi:hypothetical protein
MAPTYHKTVFRLAGLTQRARLDLLNAMRKEGIPYTVKWDGQSYLVIVKVIESYSK